MMSTHFSFVFLALLIASSVLDFWLSARQARHVIKYRAAVPAAFVDGITLEAHQKAADYTLAKLKLSFINACVQFVWIIVLTLGGGLALFGYLAAQVSVQPLVHGVLTLVMVMAASWVIDLPLSLRRTFGVEVQFGFNRITPKLYVLDLLKGVALAVILGLPFLTLVLWIQNKMGVNWWFWVWATVMGFMLLMQFLAPRFIMPLFNKFTPIEDQTLKARIEDLLTRCGFTAQGVFVMDGSKRSSHGNAYFSGFGRTKRIVFFDTLIARLTPDEIAAVLAHELGHFRHKHIFIQLVWTSLLSLFALWLAGWFVQMPWFYQGMGYPIIEPAIGLFLFMTVFPLVTAPLAPLMSHFSRRNEYQADAFAAAHEPAANLISGLVKLYRDSAATLTPDPIYTLFHASHPPAALRIAALQKAAQQVAL